MNSTSNNNLLTIKQTATQLNLSSQTVRRWMREGILPSIKFKGAVRFDPRDIDTAIEQGRRK